MSAKSKINVIKQRVLYFIVSLVVTLFSTRFFLFLSPSTNLYFGGYNVHHLYVGAVILIFVLLMMMFNIISSFLFIISGVGTAFIIDELVYIIATDGSDASYLGFLSLTGTIISAVLILILVGGMYYYAKKEVKNLNHGKAGGYSLENSKMGFLLPEMGHQYRSKAAGHKTHFSGIKRRLRKCL